MTNVRDLALKVPCPRCGVPAHQSCRVVDEWDEPRSDFPHWLRVQPFGEAYDLGYRDGHTAGVQVEHQAQQDGICAVSSETHSLNKIAAWAGDEEECEA